MRRKKEHNPLLYFQYTDEELDSLIREQETQEHTRTKRKARTPLRDNSRNIAVHLTDEQYERLHAYLNATHLPVSTYFRKLIAGERLKENAFDLTHNLHAGVNKIYSNVRQIARNPHVAELDAGAVRRLNYLADKLCEQVYLLSSQK